MKNEKIVGKLFGWDFSKGLTGWASSGSGTTWAQSGNNLSASVGSGANDYTNYYRYNSYQYVFAGSRPIVTFVPSVNATNAWEGIGIGVKNNDGLADFLVKVDLSATGTRGKLRIYKVVSGTETLLVTSSGALSFTTGTDVLSLSLNKRADGYVYAKLTNVTTGNSVMLTTTTSDSWGISRVSKTAIWHFGGTQLIQNVTLENSTPKTKPTILIGDSLTNGMYFTYVSQAYGQAYLEAGSGASSTDIVNCLDSIINSGATNAILMIGMNDAIAGVSTNDYIANIRLIVNALTENGINPSICYVTPTTNGTYNTAIQAYNAALLAEYVTAPSGFAFIDTYTPLSVANSLTGVLNSSYDSGDGIHLNSTGYALLTKTIQNAQATAANGLTNPAKSADIQIFTIGTSTWTKPAKAKAVYVLCIGPGSGGGSGAKMASGVLATGGGGGGSGAAAFATFQASDLSSTVTVTVYDGGAGGAAQSTDSTNGNPGVLGGGNTTFGAYLSAARGAVVAGAGTNSGAAVGGTANSGMFTGLTGGASSASGGNGSNGGNSTGFCASAGGGGGGVSTAPAAGTGGNGGFVFAAVSTQAAGGAATGAAGTAGSTYSGWLGSGGGGGGGNTTLNGSGGTGGAGANYGGGGGGGGACLNGSGSSGAGGKGGAGVCVVITYF